MASVKDHRVVNSPLLGGSSNFCDQVLLRNFYYDHLSSFDDPNVVAKSERANYSKSGGKDQTRVNLVSPMVLVLCKS